MWNGPAYFGISHIFMLRDYIKKKIWRSFQSFAHRSINKFCGRRQDCQVMRLGFVCNWPDRNNCFQNGPEMWSGLWCVRAYGRARKKLKTNTKIVPNTWNGNTNKIVGTHVYCVYLPLSLSLRLAFLSFSLALRSRTDSHKIWPEEFQPTH